MNDKGRKRGMERNGSAERNGGTERNGDMKWKGITERNLELGVQLYTVRDFLEPVHTLAGTLRKIREIGYDAVEFFGLRGISGAGWRELLGECGLRPCGVHALWEEIDGDLGFYIDHLKQLRCENLVIALSKDVDFESCKQVLRFAESLEAAGKVCRENGINLVYHNHNHEFLPVRGDRGEVCKGNGAGLAHHNHEFLPVGDEKGKACREDGAGLARHNHECLPVRGGSTGMEMLLENIPADCLRFELDIYQIHLAGVYFPELCGKYKGRLELLHIKDCAPGDPIRPGFPMRRIICTYPGGGNLNLPLFSRAAVAAGCRRFVVELDEIRADGDPFHALSLSYEYLKQELFL